MKKLWLFSIVGLFLAGCPSTCGDANRARATLNSAGYSDITVEGTAMPLSCSDSDNFSNKFTARNAQGVTVHGVVCCGFMKGCTVRF